MADVTKECAANLSELWKLYSQTKEYSVRNEIFSHYSVWMKRVTSSVFLRHGSRSVSWVDCVQTASVAMLETIDRFENDKGVPFEGFAYPRIKGSILNLISSEIDSTKKLITASLFYEEQDLFDAPEEVNFDSFLDAVISVAFVAFFDSTSQKFSGLSTDPYDVYVLQDQERKILSVVEKLDTTERYLIEAHYRHFLSFVQIAESLKVSRARVSQLHRQALSQLRILYEQL